MVYDLRFLCVVFKGGENTCVCGVGLAVLSPSLFFNFLTTGYIRTGNEGNVLIVNKPASQLFKRSQQNNITVISVLAISVHPLGGCSHLCVQPGE